MPLAIASAMAKGIPTGSIQSSGRSSGLAALRSRCCTSSRSRLANLSARRLSVAPRQTSRPYQARRSARAQGHLAHLGLDLFREQSGHPPSRQSGGETKSQRGACTFRQQDP